MLNQDFANNQPVPHTTNKSLSYLQSLINPYGPAKDINTIIIEVNKIFHSFDAKNYENEHPEIFEQLPDIYKKMCDKIPSIDTQSGNPIFHKILDFGCGTGFEAQQMLDNVENIDLMVCYDISPDMLSVCKKNLGQHNNVIFINDLKDIPEGVKFDVLVTNSLLHHLPEPIETIHSLDKYLKEDCFYIMGHENSTRFFKNTEIAREYNKYLQMSRIKNIKNYLHYLKKVLKIREKANIYDLTALKSVDDGLFATSPPSNLIGKIVDVQVPHNLEEANNDRGFDIKTIVLHRDWELLYKNIYGFYGRIPFNSLSYSAKRKYKEFELKYPDDGSTLCCLWKKK